MFVFRYGYRTPEKLRILFLLAAIVFGLILVSGVGAADDHHHGHEHEDEHGHGGHGRDDKHAHDEDEDGHDHDKDEQDHGDEYGHGDATQTRIDATAAVNAGVKTEIAGPARIRQTVMLYGTVRPDEERVFRLFAPYAGHVREVHASVGNRVKRGDLLAVIQ